ncbi:MAG: response regulator transcription factor [Nitrococcus sp.]|nr:response regulator transcription factor [Nitrococcus sp.]
MSRASVTQLLETSTHAKRRSGDFVILPFSSADELLSCYPACGVELVIFSIGSSSPSDDGVREEIGQLKQGLPGVPLIILSAREEPHCILKALRLGAHSYISTRLNPEVVIQALHLVRVGGTFIPPSIALEPIQDPGAGRDQVGLVAPTLLANFSPRQLEVLQLLRQGRSNKVIGSELTMQESTVKVHVREIMKKLKARNRTQAAFLAFQMDDQARAVGREHRSG